MKIKITQNCYVDGQPAKAGDEVDTKNASLLIGMGKAVPVEEKKAKKSAKVETNRMENTENLSRRDTLEKPE